MHMTLPLNTRAQDQEQQVDISVVLPDYTTVGRPHGTVRLTTHLLTNGNAETFGVAVDLTIQAEDGHSVYKQRFAYRPDELIHNAKTRKKET